jgi:hypothetical protein
VDNVDELGEVEYRVMELREDGLTEYEDGEAECPELAHNEREDLENFCLYRDDQGFCSALETKCVLQE